MTDNNLNPWKEDMERSVRFYNDWFVEYAPAVYKSKREEVEREVTNVFEYTDDFRNITPSTLMAYPQMLDCLRMATCSPLARDGLVGLSGAPYNLVKCMDAEHGSKIPSKIEPRELQRARVEGFDEHMSGFLSKPKEVDSGRSPPARLMLTPTVH
ncbi:MAG: XamI family restriction endonuclease [Candidatus Methanoplasma sp.]|jgi:hypothetical protein|nr:XamI family restriction endonuclease [Candidatus Methanoplasma sp.]